MQVKRFVLGLVAILGIGLVTACTDEQRQADRAVSDIVGRQQQIYIQNQPVPVYDYSAQRQVLLEIEHATIPELRPTWHVFIAQGVGVVDSCAGFGAPIPYESQLTNPERLGDDYNSESSILPQPEPNGLYNFGGTIATWVLCDFGFGIEPVYTENEVQTYFHAVEVRDGKIVHLKQKPSVLITTKDHP